MFDPGAVVYVNDGSFYQMSLVEHDGQTCKSIGVTAWGSLTVGHHCLESIPAEGLTEGL